MALERDLADAMMGRRSQVELATGLRASIAALCQSQAIELKNAAAAFGMSQRSLQRNLSESGLSFIGVHQDPRMIIAACLPMETQVPVTDIALHLGYNETSTFCRMRERAARPEIVRDGGKPVVPKRQAESEESRACLVPNEADKL